jgi:hypothetical protein
MNIILVLFQIFLIIVFFTGLYIYLNIDLKDKIFGVENMDDNSVSDKTKIDDNKPKCPDLLLKKGNVLFLYNTKDPLMNGINPVAFQNLDEYINYLETQRKNGIKCPVLFLQQETNTQGEDVYRVRPSPFNMQPGLTGQSGLPNKLDRQGQPENIDYKRQIDPKYTADLLMHESGNVNKGEPIEVLDANRDNIPFNAGNHAGFDPHNLHEGVYTNVDQIHNSTKLLNAGVSPNPMDTNWGGVSFTQNEVDVGKYEENNVAPPRFNNMIPFNARTNKPDM